MTTPLRHFTFGDTEQLDAVDAGDYLDELVDAGDHLERRVVEVLADIVQVLDHIARRRWPS
jgi:hypothetical protein